MSRRLEGRDETILDPELPIIDAHHHLFDRPGLHYRAEDYMDDARSGHRIVATVYVEGGSFHRQSGPEVLKPLGEVEFANGVGAMADGGRFDGLRLCAAIVGHADLRLGADVGQLLDRSMAAAPDRFRGIRQITMDYQDDTPFRYFLSGRPPAGVLEHPGFRVGFAQLASRGLVFDASGFHTHLPNLAALADDFPDARLVVDNLGIAMALDTSPAEQQAVFEAWRANLADLANRPNVVCKVSGLGMPFWGFELHDRAEPVSSTDLVPLWRPYVEAALETFGFDRCMAGSNYPPDSRSCGFVPLWNALKAIVAECSDTEKAALFSGTAARVYRIRPGL